MDNDIILFLREYSKMGLNIEIEYYMCGNVDGLIVRAKRDNFRFKYIYDWRVITTFFHSDIEAILVDFKNKFESEKERMENENV